MAATPISGADDFCAAWEPARAKIPDREKPTSFDRFFIEVLTECLFPPALPADHDEDYLVVNVDLISSTRRIYFWLPCMKLPAGNLPWPAISIKLSQLGVPLHKQPFMLHRISACADAVATAEHNKEAKVVPVKVCIRYSADHLRYKTDRMDDHILIFKEADEISELKAEPASGAAVEGLKTVKVEKEDAAAERPCPICREKMKAGGEAKEMDCGHVFHGDCLVKWLGVTNFCPHCLYKLPT